MICIACQKVDTDHFVQRTKKDGTVVHFKKCKKCHNLGQYKKRPTGLSKLNLDTQNRIRAAVQAEEKITFVAEKEGLDPRTLRKWIQKGLI